MSLHFAILFWLALIFLVAATFILVLMKTGKESKKESYLSFTVILYFWIRYINIHIYIWCAINEIIYIQSETSQRCFRLFLLIDISHSHTLIFKICFSLTSLLKITILI